MPLSYSTEVNRYNILINNSIAIFIFLLLFEILIRAIIPGVDNLINILKIGSSLIFIIYIVVFKKKVNKGFRYVHIIFWTYLLIVLLKLICEGNINYFISWLFENNNINFFFWYIYFIVFSQLRNEIDMNRLYKVLNVYNYIIIGISFILFMTNNYLGMVSYDNMLAYTWVGTNKMRMMSIFGNPNHAGLYFLLILCILDYFKLREGEKFICINNILLVICNLLTFSRTSIFCLVIYLYIRNKISMKDKKRNSLVKILNNYKISMITIIILICTFIFVQSYNIYFFDSDYVIENSRWEKWIVGFKYIIKYNLIGTPFNQSITGMSSIYGNLTFSDNMFIEIGSRFGLYLMTLVIIYIVYLLFKFVMNKNYLNLNKLLIVIISSMLSGTLHFSIPVLLFVIYAILCTDLNNKNLKKHYTKQNNRIEQKNALF